MFALCAFWVFYYAWLSIDIQSDCRLEIKITRLNGANCLFEHLSGHRSTLSFFGNELVEDIWESIKYIEVLKAGFKLINCYDWYNDYLSLISKVFRISHFIKRLKVLPELVHYEIMCKNISLIVGPYLVYSLYEIIWIFLVAHDGLYLWFDIEFYEFSNINSYYYVHLCFLLNGRPWT